MDMRSSEPPKWSAYTFDMGSPNPRPATTQGLLGQQPKGYQVNIFNPYKTYRGMIQVKVVAGPFWILMAGMVGGTARPCKGN